MIPEVPRNAERTRVGVGLGIQGELPPVLTLEGQSQGEGFELLALSQEGTAGGDDKTSASFPTLRRHGPGLG